MSRRAALLFYCQHSLGMGHLVRSLALAAGFAERFRVHFLNGGPLPKGMKLPAGVELVNLPPLGLDSEGQLVSRDRRRTLTRAQNVRRQIILETYQRTRPQVVFIELFPFGRKKFAGELLPLLEATKEARPFRPLVCCSLRDILVGKKSDQQKHDERAVRIANQFFDVVMVHSDPAFARLEESLMTHASLRSLVYYTGFVQPGGPRRPEPGRKREQQILVSAGGGLVGEKLFLTAIEAYPLLKRWCDVGMKIVTGPFLPDPAWERLRAAAAHHPGLTLKRFVPDLCSEMRASIASVSQGGYNTTLDILRAGTPSLVVPFADGAEDEQLKRARRLADRGAIRVLEQQELTPSRLATEMRALLNFNPQSLNLDLNGAANAARKVESLIGVRQRNRVAPPGGAKKVLEGHP
ncbi:MAG TPA: glycosyltransferase [Pyrinomonadaceae bacterium]|nr:glycosyltransferase [Pyrinomonadaceae bacterium]